MKQLLLLALLLCVQRANCQWTFTYGSETVSEGGSSIIEAHDDGYIVTGAANDIQGVSGDILVVKIDLTGNLVWSKEYNFGEEEEGYAITKTDDGNYLLGAGSFAGTGYLLKLDTFGDSLWSKTYSGVSNQKIRAVKESVNNQIILAMGDRIVCCNSSGDTLWTNDYGNSETISLDTDLLGNIYFPKYFNNSGYIKQGMYKIDSLGNIIVNSIVDQGHTHLPYSSTLTSDNGILTTGSTYDSGEFDLFITRFNSVGDTLWTKYYGNQGKRECGMSVIEIDNGNIVVVGYKENSSSENDAWMLMLDTNGDTIWSRQYGGYENEIASQIKSTLDQGLIFCGSTRTFGNTSVLYDHYNAWVVKTNSDGYASINQIEPSNSKSLIKIVDTIGRETEDKPNTLLIYVYSDGTTKKVYRVK